MFRKMKALHFISTLLNLFHKIPKCPCFAMFCLFVSFGKDSLGGPRYIFPGYREVDCHFISRSACFRSRMGTCLGCGSGLQAPEGWLGHQRLHWETRYQRIYCLLCGSSPAACVAAIGSHRRCAKPSHSLGTERLSSVGYCRYDALAHEPGILPGCLTNTVISPWRPQALSDTPCAGSPALP